MPLYFLHLGWPTTERDLWNMIVCELANYAVVFPMILVAS